MRTRDFQVGKTHFKGRKEREKERVEWWWCSSYRDMKASLRVGMKRKL